MTEVMTMDCRTAQELLPWYVNATLEPAERAGLEAHLAACAACAADLRAERRLAAAIAESDDLELAEEDGWARLEAALGREDAVPGGTEAPPAGIAPLPPAPRRRPRDAAPRRRQNDLGLARMSGAGAILAAAVVGFLLLGPDAVPAPSTLADPSYRTLTEEAALPDGPVLRVKAAAGVTPEALAALAARHGFTLSPEAGTAGAASGVYTLLPDTPEGIWARAETLGADPQILFATLRGTP